MRWSNGNDAPRRMISAGINLLRVIGPGLALLMGGCNKECPTCPTDQQPTKSIQISSTDLELREGGAAASYALSLSAAPAAEVRITISVESEEFGVSVTPESLSFDSGNWTEPQSVTVQAVDDHLVEGEHQELLQHAVSSGDATYNSLAMEDVTTHIEDNDTPGLSLSLTQMDLIEGGLPGIYELRLTARPRFSVVVDLSVVPGNFGIQVEPDTVIFGTENWHLPRQISVIALEDGQSEVNPQEAEVVHVVSSDDLDFDELNVDSLTLRVSDLDTPFLTAVSSPTREDQLELPLVVTLSNVSQEVVEVRVATVDGTALAGDDFAAVDTVISILPGNISNGLAIPLLDDELPEGVELFQVELSDPVGALIGAGTVTCYINDDDLPTLSLADESGMEDAGDLEFTVYLSHPVATDVSFHAETTDGSAEAGFDYTLLMSDFTIVAGDTTLAIAVELLEDSVPEGDEFFILVLSTVINAVIEDGSAVGGIEDDDGLIVFAHDLSVNEGQGELELDLILTEVSPVDVLITIETADSTAVAGDDYLTVNEDVLIPAGELTGQVTISLVDDSHAETQEVFLLNLVSAIGANIIDNQVVVTVTDDDEAQLSVSFTSVSESSPVASFLFHIDQVLDWDVDFEVTTANGSALAGSDYTTVQGGFVITAGSISRQIEVPIIADDLPEPDEYFDLYLSSVVGANGEPEPSRMTIVDDDAPSIWVSDVTVMEDAGVANFLISLSAPAGVQVTFTANTQSGSAVEDLDFQGLHEEVSIQPGWNSTLVEVVIVDDLIVEAQEYFNLIISSVQNAVPVDLLGVGRIVDDEN